MASSAISTRASPARILGQTDKGHLGPGADADVTIDSPLADRRAMFALPRLVIKAGQILFEEGEVRQHLFGPALHVAPAFDPGAMPAVRDWFERFYSVTFGNYPVEAERLEHGAVVIQCARS